MAHAGRQITKELGPTISGSQRDQVLYVYHANKLQNVWKDEWTGRGFRTPDDPAGDQTIPYDRCQVVRDLIEDHQRGHAGFNQPESIFFGELLDYDNLERVPLNFIQEWKTIKDGFLRCAHLRESDDDAAAAAPISKTFSDPQRVALRCSQQRIRTTKKLSQSGLTRV